MKLTEFSTNQLTNVGKSKKQGSLTFKIVYNMKSQPGIFRPHLISALERHS
jgi:hypothetical protein